MSGPHPPGRERSWAVNRIMSRPVVTCSPDEQHQVKRIPAVDDSGRVVGIISEADVALRAGDKKKTAEVITAIYQPG